MNTVTAPIASASASASASACECEPVKNMKPVTHTSNAGQSNPEKDELTKKENKHAKDIAELEKKNTALLRKEAEELERKRKEAEKLERKRKEAEKLEREMKEAEKLEKDGGCIRC